MSSLEERLGWLREVVEGSHVLLQEIFPRRSACFPRRGDGWAHQPALEQLRKNPFQPPEEPWAWERNGSLGCYLWPWTLRPDRSVWWGIRAAEKGGKTNMFTWWQSCDCPSSPPPLSFWKLTPRLLTDIEDQFPVPENPLNWVSVWVSAWVSVSMCATIPSLPIFNFSHFAHFTHHVCSHATPLQLLLSFYQPLLEASVLRDGKRV